MRRHVALVAVALAAAGCGEAAEAPVVAPVEPAATVAPPTVAAEAVAATTAPAAALPLVPIPEDALVPTAEGVRVLAAGSDDAAPLVAGAALAEGAQATLIVDVGSDGDGRTVTRLLVRGALDDATRFVRTVPGAWTLPVPVPGGAPEGIAWDGSRAVLAARDAEGRFIAVETDDAAAAPVAIDLGPRFAYDAIASDGSALFVAETEDVAGGEAYRIRAVDLRTGDLLPGAIVDKSGGGEAMAGVPAARVATHDWIYTVYEGGDETFVHALAASGELSLCLDLPLTEDEAARAAWSLAASADGRTVVALNARLGVAHAIVVRDGAPAEPRAVRVGPFGDAPAPLAVAGDGIAYAGADAYGIAPSDTDVRESKPLAPSPASHLVGTADGVLLLDAGWRLITRIQLPA